jgi:predicted nucleotidyltransferase
MNIKITKEQAKFIMNHKEEQFIVGSHMYGTNTDKSDVDFLIIYNSFHENLDLFYPNYHQFQWDNIDNNSQYIFTSSKQFWKNLFSGDATINADVIMFVNKYYTNKEKLNILRTYNIIKAFIGFAKRDMKNLQKDQGKNKLFHIERGLYCAEKLMNNELPQLSDIQNMNNKNIEQLKQKEAELRIKSNQMLDSGELTLFPKNPVIEPVNDLEKLLIESNNIKEFKY